MPAPKLSESDVLRYSNRSTSRATVLRFYEKWRTKHGLGKRCDNPNCRFHTEPLVWNGKPLPLILDHTNGNRHDNRPENLRFLCPNCDSQLLTRGGKNKGRVQNLNDFGYELVEQDGRRSADVFPQGQRLKMSVRQVQAIVGPRTIETK
jgi:hypothetical protein